jgi:hypothetical protein
VDDIIPWRILQARTEEADEEKQETPIPQDTIRPGHQETENTEEGGDPRTRHLDHYILPEERVGLLEIARAHGAAPSLRRRTRSDKERSDASQAETVRGFKSVQPAERVRSDCSAPVEWT